MEGRIRTMGLVFATCVLDHFMAASISPRRGETYESGNSIDEGKPKGAVTHCNLFLSLYPWLVFLNS